LRYLCIALAALLTIARFRHHRLIAQQSTDDVHLQLMQHCCAIDRVAQISVLPWLLSIYSAALCIDSANQFAPSSTDRAARHVDRSFALFFRLLSTVTFPTYSPGISRQSIGTSRVFD